MPKVRLWWKLKVFSSLRFWVCVLPRQVNGFLNSPMFLATFECPNFQESFPSLSSLSYMAYCISPLIISCPRHLWTCSLLCVFYEHVLSLFLPVLCIMWNRWTPWVNPLGIPPDRSEQTYKIICKLICKFSGLRKDLGTGKPSAQDQDHHCTQQCVGQRWVKTLKNFLPFCRWSFLNHIFV